MKNKLIKIACICLMLVSLSVIFTGCGNKSKGQITIAQIEEVLTNAEKPTFESASSVNDIECLTQNNADTYSYTCIRWQQKLEDNNIDTTDLMSVSKMRYKVFYNQSDVRYYYIYVFKFAETDEAEDCYNKLKKLNIVIENDYDYYGTADYSNKAYKNYKYKAKQYGNLVVYAYDEMANYIFDLIDDIKAK